MTTKLRRTATRLAAAGLATVVLGGAAAAGASAAQPQTCDNSTLTRAVDVALSLRSALDPSTPTTC